MVPPPPADDGGELSWRQRPRPAPGPSASAATSSAAGGPSNNSTLKASHSHASSSIAMASHTNAGKPFHHIFAPPASHAAASAKPSSPRKVKGTDSDNWRSHDHHPPPHHHHHHHGHAALSPGKAHFAALAPSASSSASSSATAVPTLSTSHGHRQAPGDAFKFGGFAAHKAGGSGAAAKPAVSGSLPKARPPREAGADPDAGPAAPLRPLQLAAASRGLAHPNQTPLLGGENWALTPSDSLPSLPGTPRKPNSSSSEAPGGWVADAGAMGPRGLVVTRGFRSTPSPTLAAGSVASQQSTGGSATMSSLARSLVASGSPKRSSLVLPGAAASGSDSNAGSPRLGQAAVPSGAASAASSSSSGPAASRPPSLLLRPSPGPSPRLGHRTATPLTSSHLASMEEEGADAGSSNHARSILSPTHGMPPSLLRKESSASMTSSGAGSAPPSAALLSASRRASVVYASTASPSPSMAGSTTAAAHAAAAAAAYGIYRPPHLRNRGSAHNLQPLVAHYDRVRDPSIRGQSRSPDPSVAASSRAGSRAPSVAPFSPGESLIDGRPGGGGRRRLSSLGSFHSSLAASEYGDAARAEASLNGWASTSIAGDDAGGTGSGGGSSAFFTSPAEATHDHFGGGPAVGNLFTPGGAGMLRKEATDELDLEDMMAASATRSITDSYCMSRQGSGTTSGEPVDIFQLGERIGPGLMHDGYRITIAPTSAGFLDQPDDKTGSQLEIVRKLGEGSYAVVYLVREVDPLPEQGDGDGLFGDADDEDVHAGTPSAAKAMSGAAASTTAKESADEEEDLYGRTLRPEDEAGGNTLSRRQSTSAMNTGKGPGESGSPREFALKCLCKRDLSDEMLEVQRLESTIHQSIPPHPNIVTLYRTYETPEWLFLVLEYCPGQDLYYWLERAQDSEGVSSPPTGTIDGGSADVTISGDTTAGHLGGVDSTPPSPSLLASTAGNTLLSRKRLRLVSRMFRQMCDSVQFCHDRGISHRDIKPENFIVEDRRLEVMGFDVDGSGHQQQPSIEEQLQSANSNTSTPSRAPMHRSVSVMSSASAWGDSSRSDGRVIVKLTDFGLAVAQDRCIDFDCGSKPYMAYECRNNVVEWYDPKQADIWSLGVVLLNLIFHRSPFSEPSTENCDSFAAYVYDPVSFLMQAFEGLTEGMASFFATRVFCDVTNTNPDGSARKRISAAEFGAWAMDLVEHLGLEKGAEAKVVSRGADEGITSPMEHSRSPSRSALASLMSSPAIHRLSLHGDEGDELDDMENYPSLFPEYATGPATPSTATVTAPGTAGLVAAAPIAAERSMDAVREEESPPQSNSTSLPDTDTVEGPSSETNHAGSEAREEAPAEQSAGARDESKESEVEPTAEGNPAPSGTSTQGEDDQAAAAPTDSSEADADSVRPPLSTVSSNPKRRKRGQRKGRTALKQELKRSRSHENFKMTVSAPHDGSTSPGLSHPRDAVLAELAEASQTLAREMSKAMKAQGGLHGPASLPTTPLLPNFKRPTQLSVGSTSGQHGENGFAAQSDEHLLAGDAASILGSASSRASTQFTNLSLVDRERLSSALGPADELEPPTLTSPVTGGGASGSSSASKWGSAAHRRERMIAERAQRSQETSGSSLPAAGGGASTGGGKTRRDRNQSNASIDSLSSLGSFMTDGTSSIYSTASAPPALAIRRSIEASSRRSRPTYGLQLGLESISERDRERREKDLDPSYLAAIFGGKAKTSPAQRREKEKRKDVLPPVPSKPVVGATRAPASPRVEAALAAVAAAQAQAQAQAQRSDDALSLRSAAGGARREEALGPGSVGMRKDASTSTSSLVDPSASQHGTSSSPSVVGESAASAGTKTSTSNGTSGSASVDEAAAATAPRKKAGLSKFLTSVRSYNASRAGSGRSET